MDPITQLSHLLLVRHEEGYCYSMGAGGALADRHLQLVETATEGV